MAEACGSDASLTCAPGQPGSRAEGSIPRRGQLADYLLLGEIGSGSLGRVLLIRHASSRHLFAMKVVAHTTRVTASQRARVQREDDLLAAMSHPFIVRLHESFGDACYSYYVMTYAPGGDLMTLILQHGRLTEPASRVVLASITLALQYLHEVREIVLHSRPAAKACPTPKVKA
jgi:serine/threonine protein kinase